MANAKYQIFVSSTYEDLKGERDQVIRACLEMGHIPVGMEMFSAADEEQWKMITRQIDESDYYVVIIAHRYGSTVGDISYTEKEYDYAVQKGIPTLGFIINESAPWPGDQIETNDEIRIKLDNFKQKVMRKPVDFWSSREDLHARCAIALMKSFNTRPRPGWVRALEMPGPEVASEISRLSSENARLREDLSKLRKAPDTSHLAQGDDEVILVVRRPATEAIQPAKLSTTWNDLFPVVAAAILTKPEEQDIKRGIILAFYSQLGLGSRQEVNECELDGDDFMMLKTQFIALGLVTIDYVARNFEDFTTMFGKTLETTVLPIWKLTPGGESKYAELAAKRHIQL